MSHYRFILVLVVLTVGFWVESGWAHKGPHGLLLGAKCGIQDADIKADALAAIERARQQKGAGAEVEAGTGATLALSEADRSLVEKAKAQAAAGDIEGVLATTRALKWSDRGPVLENIVNTLVKAAKLDAALALAEHMQIQDARVRALVGIARGQAGAGDAKAAGKTLNRAADVSSTIGTAYGRIEALVMIARAMGNLGDKEGARRLLGYARAEIEKINDTYDLDMLLSKIAKGHAAIGDFEAAVETVQGDQDDPQCQKMS